MLCSRGCDSKATKMLEVTQDARACLPWDMGGEWEGRLRKEGLGWSQAPLHPSGDQPFWFVPDQRVSPLRMQES